VDDSITYRNGLDGARLEDDSIRNAQAGPSRAKTMAKSAQA
jgi:hypothetical protein